MTWTFEALNDFFSSPDITPLLAGAKHGVERETLRVDMEGMLSGKRHPKAFGSPLFHPYITMDYSEAQLELVTPPLTSEEEAFHFLSQLHRYVYSNLDQEMLWPFSAPCVLPDEDKIPLANFGSVEKGKIERIYRRGLGHRYGRKMQTLSGVHYNFSLGDALWSRLYDKWGKSMNRTDFISESYLHIARNYLREGWITCYLFGATPALDESFLSKPNDHLVTYGSRTYYGKYATTLRMSSIGYYSKVHLQVGIDYNTLERYIADLGFAVSQENSKFVVIGLGPKENPFQLNTHYFQRESEHYARIRPKPKYGSNHPLEALSETGIDYLEVRSLDLNPFSISGIEQDQIYFLRLFLIYSLMKPSRILSDEDKLEITDVKDLVAFRGREPGLNLTRGQKSIALRDWAEEILDGMEEVAKLHQGHHYLDCLVRQRKKIVDPSLTPSSQVLEEMFRSHKSFVDYGMELAKRHREEVLQIKKDEVMNQEFEEASKKSLEDLMKEEILEDYFLKGYEDLEPSTQLIVREALNRGVEVEFLDRADNFIRLKKGSKTEVLKQGTKTSRDSLLTYFIMENKKVTKFLLEEAGFRVPKGKIFDRQDEALAAYSEFPPKKMVIKPNFTNYGIGITMVEPDDFTGYKKGVELAFYHSSEIMIEEFISGEEFRFLIIGGKCHAICQRKPANIVGDGSQTVKELVYQKNADPRCYKMEYPIQIGEHETEVLLEQRLNWGSIPEAGQVVYLRHISNVSTGGDPLDRTDDIPIGYQQIAVEAARLVDATFCGVDMIINDIEQDPSIDNFAIIELNFNPAIFLHRYPVEGKKRYVEKAVLDQLGF